MARPACAVAEAVRRTRSDRTTRDLARHYDALSQKLHVVWCASARTLDNCFAARQIQIFCVRDEP